LFQIRHTLNGVDYWFCYFHYRCYWAHFKVTVYSEQRGETPLWVDGGQAALHSGAKQTWSRRKRNQGSNLKLIGGDHERDR